jgi:3-carboxy-cis,cis-muconate cycloisomerase
VGVPLPPNTGYTLRMNLLDPLFRSKAIDAHFTDAACLQGMLDFEAALARAEARVGVIPVAAAPPIAAKCQADLFDAAAIANAAALSGNLAIPLVKQLTALVARDNKEAARYVHWGATSQDAIDTGCILQLGPALEKIVAELDRVASALVPLSEKYRVTPIAGRTWMQQALPTTFGLKLAGWLDALDRHRARLRETQKRSLVLQFGGAVGTLASLHTKGLDVAQALADDLHLPLPALPWHSHRDRVAEIATTLGLLCGTLGKIGCDISLLMQTEVAELSEPAGEGRGRSSTMPHKRNPLTSAVLLAAAARVPSLVSTMLSSMGQQHERGLGGWHAEWETLPEIVQLVGGALHHLSETLPGLEIHPQKMRENLNLTHGLISAEAVAMALGEELGKQAAHELIETACRRASAQGQHLREVLSQDSTVTKHLSPAKMDQLFDPQQYLGVADHLITRALDAHRAAPPKSGKESE